jgi:UDPglucose--hexose-1-phosphate uridylyltransferase
VPELRRDPLSGRWVVIAAERARRPRDFTRQPRLKATGSGACPFCEGNERETPPEVLGYRVEGSVADGPGWQLRVVPNLYPALGPARGELDPQEDGVYVSMQALGAHEVVIITPEHEEEVAKLPDAQLGLMVQSFIDRHRVHAANPLVAYVHATMNYGREAGASREHPHAQLFALPLVPTLIEQELAVCQAHFESHGACLFCDVLGQELASGSRLVWQDERMVLFAPYASRAPFELWLAPKKHAPGFETMEVGDVASFVSGLKQALVRLHDDLSDPPFNFWLHTAPTARDVAPFYHWHLELQPKLSIAAGFELGTDVMINTMPPESAAAFLREHKGPPA